MNAVVPHKIMHVFLEQVVGTEPLINVMDERNVLKVIHIAFRENAFLTQQLFGMFRSVISERYGALLFIFFVIVFCQQRNNTVDLSIEIRFVFGRP